MEYGNSGNVAHNPLYTLFPNYFADGAIFSKMQNAPWNTIGVGLDMDIAYLASYSGIKAASYFIYQFRDENMEVDQQKLANTLWNLYGKNWQRLWDAYTAEYDPLNNYDVNETINRQLINDRDIQKDTKDNRSIDTTDDIDSTTKVGQTGSSKFSGTESTEYGRKVTSDSTENNYTHGYNSTSAVPSSMSTSSSNEVNSGSDTVTTSNNTNTNNDSETTVNSTDVTSTTSTATIGETTADNQKENEEILRTRKGNIGQNTYQELLSQEFNLWKQNFYEKVFADCDRLLVLSVYSDSCLRNYS